jgi:hypothetical protein
MHNSHLYVWATWKACRTGRERMGWDLWLYEEIQEQGQGPRRWMKDNA